MIKELSYIIITILSPAEHAGVQFQTVEIVDCIYYSDIFHNIFESNNISIMTQCIYTDVKPLRPILKYN